VNFRPDVYDLDSTGFVVGQPLAPGELSDDGQRYVLKAQVYKVEEVPEGFSIFGSRRRTASTGNDEPFSFFRPRSRDEGRTSFFGSTDTKAKKSLADDDDSDGVVFNFNRSSSGNAKKKIFYDFKKKKWLGADKADATATGKKKPGTNVKKKKVDQTASNQKKPQTTTSAQPVKKKKKVEEASATSAAAPAAKPAAPGPVFGGQQ
jgi:hypothetical protein